MHDRHENMEDIKKAVTAASKTLKSSTPDLAVVRSSAHLIAGLAPKVSTWFPAGTGPDVGKTGAKPEIWQKPEDFSAKTKDLQQAATAFDAAAKGGDLNAISARFGELGKSCKACHDTYRKDMHH
ncbi:MAG: cytochrome c [Sphingomicrobium sp.]